MKIYYAHHVWKYGTPIEDYEIDCIVNQFDDVEIINPRTTLQQNRPEHEILSAAYETITKCDALVFSTVSGMIGHGIFNEIAEPLIMVFQSINLKATLVIRLMMQT